MDIEFQGYRKKTKEEIDFLWKNAIFTFDTNSLLNIYRYSETTRKDIFEIITKIEDRIFLTHQVAFEFNKNRFENINNIIKSKNEFLKNLDAINIQISKNSEQILSNYLTDKFAILLDEIRAEIDSKIEFFNKLFDSDLIFALINLLFRDKILNEIEEEKVAQIKKIGEIRYSNKIPPGYSDAKKEENRFGDLIIWNEIINYAKEKQKPIIFISDDSKEDWVWKLKDGKIIGARPELIQEFYKETNQLFHLYKTDSFVKYASIQLNEKIDSGTIEEVTKINKEISLSEFAEYLNSLEDEIIEEKLKILTPREADLLRLNLGVGGKHKLSVKEIAETFDLDLNRALTIRSSAMRKLRNAEFNNQ